jgi:hypothetical protein
MIITKLNLKDLSECSIDISKESKPIDIFGMLKYLDGCKTDNWVYINWEKQLFDKKLLQVL